MGFRQNHIKDLEWQDVKVTVTEVKPGRQIQIVWQES